jgi:hypothetical protein
MYPKAKSVKTTRPIEISADIELCAGRLLTNLMRHNTALRIGSKRGAAKPQTACKLRIFANLYLVVHSPETFPTAC